MQSQNSDISKITAILKEGMFSIDSLTQRVDREVLSLAYSPGVGNVCTNIHDNMALAPRLTMILRSAAIVSDGGLFGCSENAFKPVMDWFVFQIKQYVGVDAYPFVVMKGADLTNIFQNMTNTYSAIIYLDDRTDFKVPSKSLFIRHQSILQLAKSQLSDAKATAHALSYLMSKKVRGQPSKQDCQTAINAPTVFANHKPIDFVIPEGTLEERAFKFHEHFQGKIHIKTSNHKVSELKELFTEANLRELIKQKVTVSKINKVAAIVTDGTAILGLGNIGPIAGLPVMEGKSLLFKLLGEVDVVPFCMNPMPEQQEVELIAQTIGNFMAVNLEDIKAPQCFGVEQGLKAKNLLPIFHDDQHGTAIVTLAALINSLKLVGKDASQIKIVINGAGAAGITIAKLILAYGNKDMVVCDSKGAIYQGRAEGMNQSKRQLASITNPQQQKGSLQDVIEGADVFIGVSAAGALKGEWLHKMKKQPIIFAMANPVPQILPEQAKKNGAFIYGSGRSDFQNQINNSLVFPGIFRGIKQHEVKEVTTEIKTRVAVALAKCVDKPTPGCIIPSSLDMRIGKMISDEIGQHLQKL